MQKVTLSVEGMTCSACSSAIENFIKKQDGVSEVNVNLILATCTVEFDETKLSVKDIEGFIKQVGYKSAGVYKLNSTSVILKKKKLNLIIFGVLTALEMAFSMLGMANLLPKALSHGVVFASVQLAICLLFLVYGIDIFIRGFKSLFLLKPNMDSLVSLGVLFSFGYSLYSFVNIALGHAHFMHSLYFEACVCVIYFIKLGRFLDSLAKDKTKSAISDLVTITPSYAYLKNGQGEVRVTLDKVKQGDILVLRAGEKVAVDGEVVSGACHVDESFISGESQPVKKQVGSKVVAGAISFDGYIEYRAEQIGKDSTISQIVNLVVSASSTKMDKSKVADKVSAIFIPCIMAIALICFVIYMIVTRSVERSLITAVTILVVACPCALGLGTPVAVVVGEGVCAKNGILIKDSQIMENASRVDVVVFDKTGTLTYGKQTISKVDASDEGLAFSVACSLEELSSHPISSAFKEKKKELGLETKAVENFEEISGMGLAGLIDGKLCLIGNSRLMGKYNVKHEKPAEEEGLDSYVFVARGGELLGVIYLEDQLREDAKSVVSRLKERHIKTVMLTGDNQGVAEYVAKNVGVDEVYSGVSPSQKADFIKKLKAEGRVVMMVGDGINDSPALALADVGVSISASKDIAVNSSNVLILSNDLGKLCQLLVASRKTLGVIKQNLFWAFFYNCLMVPIAAGAFSWAGLTISPMLASLAMVLSSLCVVLNALRLYKIKFGGSNEKV